MLSTFLQFRKYQVFHLLGHSQVLWVLSFVSLIFHLYHQPFLSIFFSSFFLFFFSLFLFNYSLTLSLWIFLHLFVTRFCFQAVLWSSFSITDVSQAPAVSHITCLSWSLCCQLLPLSLRLLGDQWHYICKSSLVWWCTLRISASGSLGKRIALGLKPTWLT